MANKNTSSNSNAKAVEIIDKITIKSCESIACPNSNGYTLDGNANFQCGTHKINWSKAVADTNFYDTPHPRQIMGQMTHGTQHRCVTSTKAHLGLAFENGGNKDYIEGGGDGWAGRICMPKYGFKCLEINGTVNTRKKMVDWAKNNAKVGDACFMSKGNIRGVGHGCFFNGTIWVSDFYQSQPLVYNLPSYNNVEVYRMTNCTAEGGGSSSESSSVSKPSSASSSQQQKKGGMKLNTEKKTTLELHYTKTDTFASQYACCGKLTMNDNISGYIMEGGANGNTRSTKNTTAPNGFNFPIKMTNSWTKWILDNRNNDGFAKYVFKNCMNSNTSAKMYIPMFMYNKERYYLVGGEITSQFPSAKCLIIGSAQPKETTVNKKYKVYKYDNATSTSYDLFYRLWQRCKSICGGKFDTKTNIGYISIN